MSHRHTTPCNAIAQLPQFPAERELPRLLFPFFPVHFLQRYFWVLSSESSWKHASVASYELPPSWRENAEQPCSGGRSRN